ncbi:PucR family transcriptional regulator [Brevibacterium sp. 5221]|uniref:PucR family transcriptional regulator n=1 Tax=Brevibacterium rongguiense TaxID=2695267 RepID=A0A6N9H546_9MICO|nr:MULTISPECIES: helix-turn-helix domain-containing protein [Brevibacterium]MYM19013.1 PucR family transcriptional regulator [Brevibacterium rongguiense]WAL40698.1 helix-turn-helix domain-containing protein [Brevibacterium sp. BRM-1]
MAQTKDAAPTSTAGRAETIRRLKAGQALLSKITLHHMESQLPWYRSMNTADRGWVVVLANSGISSFIEWYRNPSAPLRVVSEIFKSAPRELVRSVNLQQTLQLLRVVVEVVEERVGDLARPDEQRELRDAVLVYSREIAFAAADVYARAAEARGSWDARLEAMVVDALVRGDSVDELASRTAAFGWRSQAPVRVLMGRAPQRKAHRGTNEIRRAAQKWAEDALVGIHDDRLLIVLGGVESADEAAASLSQFFGPSDVVIGPEVASLAEAGTSAAAAVWGLRTAAARPATPRPVYADDLLPERAVAGDERAVRALTSRYYEPLAAGSGQLLDTVASYLEFGGSLETTAKALQVHPNTVRYRLRKITDLVGADPTDARTGFVVRIALVYGRLSEAGQLSRTDKIRG